MKAFLSKDTYESEKSNQRLYKVQNTERALQLTETQPTQLQHRQKTCEVDSPSCLLSCENGNWKQVAKKNMPRVDKDMKQLQRSSSVSRNGRWFQQLEMAWQLLDIAPTVWSSSAPRFLPKGNQRTVSTHSDSCMDGHGDCVYSSQSRTGKSQVSIHIGIHFRKK